MAISVFPAPSTGAAQPYEQIFTTSGTWTKPAGVKSVEVTVVGGGGGGNTTSGPGGGGGFFRGSVNVEALSSVPVTVGVGGPANSAGGDSSFGSLVACTGGTAGQGTTNGGHSGRWFFPSIFGKTYLQLTGPFSVTHGTGADYTSGAIHSNGSYAIAVPSSGNTVRKSLNGTFASSTTHTLATSIGAVGQTQLAWGNGIWVLIWRGRSPGLYFTSTDGQTWTQRSLPFVPMKVTFANGIFFMTGSLQREMYSSTDGTTWTVINNSQFPQALMQGPVVYMPTLNKFVAYTNDTSQLYESTDGATWTLITGVNTTTDFTAHEISPVVASDGFVYVNRPTTQVLHVSSNGRNFTSTSAPITTRTFAETTAGLWCIAENLTNGNRYAPEIGGPWVQLPAVASSSFRAFAHNDNLILFNVNAGTATTIQGLLGQPGIFYGNGNATVGGLGAGAGGTVGLQGGVPGPGIDGFSPGGNSFSSSTGRVVPFGGGAHSSDTARGGQGIVIVRWWA